MGEYKKGCKIDAKLVEKGKKEETRRGTGVSKNNANIIRCLVVQNTTITLYLVAVYRRRDYYNKVALR